MPAVKYDYCGGVLIESIIEGVKNDGNNQSKRGIVRSFSTKSSSSMGRYLRGCVSDYKYMLTLTYPENCEQSINAKSHLKSFVLRLQRHLDSVGLFGTESKGTELHHQQSSFFWFVEFQRNGSPHFHILTNYRFDYKLVATCWYEVVGTADRKHLDAGTRTERLRLGRKGCVSYAKKYARKNEQKELPPMYKDSGFGRWWGIIGNRAVVEAATQFPIGVERTKDTDFCLKTVQSTIEALVEAGKLKLMPYKMCKCWVTDDEPTRKLLLELIKDTEDCKHGDKMLPKASSNRTKNLYAYRRG